MVRQGPGGLQDLKIAFQGGDESPAVCFGLRSPADLAGIESKAESDLQDPDRAARAQPFPDLQRFQIFFLRFRFRAGNRVKILPVLRMIQRIRSVARAEGVRTGNETDEKSGSEANTRTGSESDVKSGSESLYL